MNKIFPNIIIASLFLLIVSPHGKILANEPLSVGNRYIIAANGLRLREAPNLKSKTVMVMPYRERVNIISEKKIGESFSVDNIPGYWLQISMSGKTGYAFSGYLAHYPPPKGNNLRKYSARLISLGFDVKKKKTSYDGSGNHHAGQEVELVLKKAGIAESFLIGRRLFGISRSLKYPGNGENKEQTYVDPNKPKNRWSQDLVAIRNDDGELQEIRYYLRAEGGGITCFIKYQEGRGTTLTQYHFSD